MMPEVKPVLKAMAKKATLFLQPFALASTAVVHGIPSPSILLKQGDIISLDIGMLYKGFYTDTAITVPEGQFLVWRQGLSRPQKNALMRP